MRGVATSSPPSVSEPAQIEAPKTFSHIPEQCEAHHEALRDIAIIEVLWDSKSKGESSYEGAADTASMDICNIGEAIANYGMAKMLTDECLNKWIDEHRVQVLRIGIGSQAMKDLFAAVHAQILLVLSDKESVRVRYREMLRPRMSQEIRDAMDEDEAAVKADEAGLRK